MLVLSVVEVFPNYPLECMPWPQTPGLPVDFFTGLLAKLLPGETFTVCDHPLGNNIRFHPFFHSIAQVFNFLLYVFFSLPSFYYDLLRLVQLI